MVSAAAEALGRPLMPHQRYVVDVLGEVQSEAAGDPEPGRWAYDDGLVLMPRRSGKTVVVQPMVARVCGGAVKATAWAMAQSRDAAVRRWRDTTDVLLPALDQLVRRKVSIAHEELRWPATGSVYLPVAPNDEAMHGEEPALVTIDELWTLTTAELAALEDGFRPAWSVTDGQSVKMSAAGVLRSSALKRERVRGREAVVRGNRLGLAMFEWALPDTIAGVPVDELSDRQLLDAVMAMHPRGGGRGLRMSFLAQELGKGRTRFLRHYGGHDDHTGGHDAVIDIGKLQAAAASEQIPVDARVALVVELDPDGLEASIAAGVRLGDGVAQIEAVERRPGVRWSGPRLVELAQSSPVGLVAVVATGPARDVADEIEPYLTELGIDLLRLGSADLAAACGRLKSSIEQQHPPEQVGVRVQDPDGSIEAAVLAAGVTRWRAGNVFVRTGTEPISMLNAAAVALWCVDKVPAPPAPRRPFRVF
ncbi:MAG: hypothetical protein QM582_09500 [Micropruina sp.]|uniref:hypothetical protein n=1 Tax=Micropruina sp. TaxID=2737536 RepID=UPI0039E623CA